MAFTPSPNASWIVLVEIEVGHWISLDTWTQAAAPNTNAWYISHTAADSYGEHEGKPSRVKENGVEYTEKSSLADCHATASTWYWDAATSRLYVHTSGGDNPHQDKYIILSYVWRRFGSTVYVYGGKPYLPFIASDSIPNVNFATGPYHQGQTQQTFGTISLLNGSKYFDSDLSSYVYEGKRAIVRLGRAGAADADFLRVWDGWTSNIEWTEERVMVDIEDLMTAVL